MDEKKDTVQELERTAQMLHCSTYMIWSTITRKYERNTAHRYMSKVASYYQWALLFSRIANKSVGRFIWTPNDSCRISSIKIHQIHKTDRKLRSWQQLQRWVERTRLPTTFVVRFFRARSWFGLRSLAQ